MTKLLKYSSSYVEMEFGEVVITEMVVKLLKLGSSNTEVDFLWFGSSAIVNKVVVILLERERER